MIRQAHKFSKQGLDAFFDEWKEEILDIDDYTRLFYGDTAEKVYELCRRHSEDTGRAITVMRNLYDAPWADYNPSSFFSLIINSKAYQRNIPAEMVCEGMADYAATGDYKSYDDHRQHPPARGIKQICIE